MILHRMVDFQLGADLAASYQLHPSGRHALEIQIVGVGVPVHFTQEQARWIKAACEEFLRECDFDDGAPTDRINPVRRALMQGVHVGEVAR